MAAPVRRFTPEEYLALERKAESKSEYLNGQIFAMAGASFRHTSINDNLVGELHTRLKGTPCRPLSRDMRVKVEATGLYTYPDALILCGEPRLEDRHGDTLLNPRVIFEVLSPNTERYDRGAKFPHYQQIESLTDYILISQEEPVCEQYVRGPNGTWILTTLNGLDTELVISSVPVRIRLADIYAGVSFEATPSGDKLPAD